MDSSRKLVKVSNELPNVVSETYVRDVDGGCFSLTYKQQKVYEFIRENPGVWRKELERRFGNGVINMVWKLIRVGLVRYEYDLDGRFRVYAVVGNGDS